MPEATPAADRLTALLREIEAARERERATRRPPVRRIGVAVLAACLIGGALIAAIASPAVRHQLALSFTREPARYVEVFFAAPLLQRETPGGPAVQVPVRVHAHGDELRAQAVVLSVRRSGRTTTRRAVVDLDAGQARTVVLSAPIPAGAGPWRASVALPGRTERLQFTSPDPRTGP